MESWKTDLFKGSLLFQSVHERERERESAMCLFSFVRAPPAPEQISWRTSAIVMWRLHGDREGPAYASNVPSALDIDTDA